MLKQSANQYQLLLCEHDVYISDEAIFSFFADRDKTDVFDYPDFAYKIFRSAVENKYLWWGLSQWNTFGYWLSPETLLKFIESCTS